MKKKTANPPCHCHSGVGFTECCQPVLSGTQQATDAETLMRSRYTAFAINDATYLLQSWHPSTRPASLNPEDHLSTKWIGLQIKHHEQQDPQHATVEFIARCRVNGRASRLHETSRFIRENGRWYYVDGDIHEG